MMTLREHPDFTSDRPLQCAVVVPVGIVIITIGPP